MNWVYKVFLNDMRAQMATHPTEKTTPRGRWAGTLWAGQSIRTTQRRGLKNTSTTMLQTTTDQLTPRSSELTKDIVSSASGRSPATNPERRRNTTSCLRRECRREHCTLKNVEPSSCESGANTDLCASEKMSPTRQAHTRNSSAELDSMR